MVYAPDQYRSAPDIGTIVALERLTGDLHALIFDLQDASTRGSEIRNAAEGRRIASAIDRLFPASP